MREIFSDKLYADFPQIFNKRNALSMPLGFECGEGWFKLIYMLCHDLMRFSKESGIKPPRAEQIKEKFGALRVYMSGYNETMYERIEQACEVSLSICEVCGEEGRRYDDRPWYQTLCEKHAEEQVRR
ncbi:MAG: hypothetical protein R8M38_03210 [Mariprofundaceae bacterium]